MRVAVLGLLFLASALCGVAPVAADSNAVTATLEYEPDAFGRPPRREIPFGRSPCPLPTPQAKTALVVLGVDYEVWLAVDTSGKAWKLWADGDKSGVFTDDELTRFTPRGQTGRAEIDLLVPVGGHHDLPVRLVATVHKDRPLEIEILGHRRGTVIVAGRLRPIVLVDGNANLRFDEPDTDHVLLDVDGDGRLGRSATSPDWLRPDARLRLGKRGYRIKVVDPHGAAVTFEPASVPERLRPWPPIMAPASARRPMPPAEDFVVLEARFRHERPLRPKKRVKTVLLIGRVGTPDACVLLREIVSTDKHEDVRVAAVRSIGSRAYYPCGAAALLAMALEGAPDVRRAAIPALHDMGHPDRAEAYASMLESTDPALAGGAARYLAFSGSPKARAQIRRRRNRGLGQSLESDTATTAEVNAAVFGVRRVVMPE